MQQSDDRVLERADELVDLLDTPLPLTRAEIFKRCLPVLRAIRDEAVAATLDDQHAQIAAVLDEFRKSDDEPKMGRVSPTCGLRGWIQGAIIEAKMEADDD